MVNGQSETIILRAEKLELGYRRGEAVVRDLHLDVQRGEIVTLVGPNGSGKSTILRAMARILRPRGGAVYLNGAAIHRLSTRKVAQELAILPQHPIAPGDLTVRDLVQRGRFARQAWWRASNLHDRDVIGWALDSAGLTDLADRRLGTLSGGERQRAWIALALAQEPEILLLDEPTTFLDISHQLEVMALLRKLNAEDGLSIAMVLHDLNQAARFSHRLIAIHEGSVYAAGAPDTVLTEGMLREVFQVEGVIGRDPHTDAPVFTPLYSLRGGSEPRGDAADG
ncbi:MAG TPA: ABC transporter ATP-binding protein [Aggregatilinea sp.]|uniref:ABC transporter ATP-binding protein n=1 Tax=Aggregatilinea sp. TaxID=2806333 RepID=UPI002BAB81EB|nr:ABC transporter ATP-binding protein [Aggregatilinea sp.]HML23652.1 ABC transporter ATP-binding protein [Aggregatilinea sp.]